MRYLTEQTAWSMTAPAPYSLFHLSFTAVGILLAVSAAKKLSRLPGRRFCQTLFFCGLLLGASEVYKQFFLYYVVNGEVYDWWYFPFQLCSLPMYFCLLLPLIPSEKLKIWLCTFMQDFNLLGGAMALIEPSGLMHPYWTLTIHGLSWHIVLIFIGLLIGFSGHSDTSLNGFMKTLPLFGFCCMIASLINVATHSIGNANMFYISPYYPTGQAVFHQISLKTGILAGNIIYLSSICLGGFLCHLGMKRLCFKAVTTKANPTITGGIK